MNPSLWKINFAIIIITPTHTYTLRKKKCSRGSGYFGQSDSTDLGEYCASRSRNRLRFTPSSSQFFFLAYMERLLSFFKLSSRVLDGEGE